jgi:predicted metal-binding membrane protein
MGPIARCLAVAVPLLVAFAQPVHSQQQSVTTVEKLLTDGWEVAGYVSAWENRSLVLFKHKDQRYLVQCSVLIDVLRNPRVVTYCYEIK